MKSGTKNILSSNTWIVTKGTPLAWEVKAGSGTLKVELNVEWEPADADKNTIKWNFKNEEVKLVITLNGPITPLSTSCSEPCKFAELGGKPICFLVFFHGTSHFCNVVIQIEHGE